MPWFVHIDKGWFQRLEMHVHLYKDFVYVANFHLHWLKMSFSDTSVDLDDDDDGHIFLKIVGNEYILTYSIEI